MLGKTGQVLESRLADDLRMWQLAPGPLKML